MRTRPPQFLSSLLVDINDRWGLGVAVWPSMSDKIKADEAELNNFGIPAVMAGAVLYGDPMINKSNDTIEQVDMWYLQAIGQLLTIAMATLVMPGSLTMALTSRNAVRGRGRRLGAPADGRSRPRSSWIPKRPVSVLARKSSISPSSMSMATS